VGAWRIFTPRAYCSIFGASCATRGAVFYNLSSAATNFCVRHCGLTAARASAQIVAYALVQAFCACRGAAGVSRRQMNRTCFTSAPATRFPLFVLSRRKRRQWRAVASAWRLDGGMHRAYGESESAMKEKWQHVSITPWRIDVENISRGASRLRGIIKRAGINARGALGAQTWKGLICACASSAFACAHRGFASFAAFGGCCGGCCFLF